MNGQLFFYLIAGALALYFIRRFFLVRSIPTYTPSEVQEKLRDGQSFLLLDVRTTREWDHGHLKGATHIPLQELGRRSESLGKHKGREIVCYCQTGNRSLTAALRLKRLGFTVAHMKGGIAEWNFQNLR